MIRISQTLAILISLAQFPCCLAAERIEVAAEVLEAQKQRVAIMQQAADATVAIFGLDGGGGGSGVIVSPDGYALTNYHVSSACGDHMRCGLNDGKMYDAVIVGVDATGDVSLIKLLGRDDFPTAPLADSDQVRVGQWCFAAGNPFVLATNLQPSISLGIVSGVNRYQYPAGTLLEYADCIQTDAAINPGNSGGPLFNLAGEVIGINGRCSFEKRGRVNVGVGYAISSNQVKYFMGVLKSGRLVDHATLGATVATDETGKILVSNILSASDAYRRGLRYGDEVLSLADREVRTTNMFKNILGTLPRDWRVPIEIRREGVNKTLLIRLEGVHSEKQLIDLVAGEMAPGQEAPDTPNDEEQGEEDTQKPQELDTDSQLDESLEAIRPNTELVNSMLEARSGFANYYFNRVNRERVWNNIQQLGDFTLPGDPNSQSTIRWKLSGKLASEPTTVTIDVSAQEGALSIGSRSANIQPNTAVSDTIHRRNESGMIVALQALQNLLQVGPERLGASTYLGTRPVYLTSNPRLSEQPLHDVLQTLWYDAKVVFYADPVSGQISSIEVFGDTGDDPVEVYLSDYKPVAFAGIADREVMFPGRMRLQYGSEPMLLIDIQEPNLNFSDPPVQAGDANTGGAL